MRANEPSQINQRDSGAQQLQSLLWGTTSATESAPGAGLPQPPVQWEAAVSASKAIEERTTRAVAALTEAIGYLQKLDCNFEIEHLY